MRKVERTNIVDYQTYNDTREQYRAQVLEHKLARRIAVGEYLTFLFETTETIRYQVQEMMRMENIAREKDIVHEIETYNALLGEAGELGCTLLIGIDNEQLRDEKLRQWLGLPAHIYLLLESGERANAQWDPAQVGDDRLSSVQYLKFRVGQSPPVAIGCEHPELVVETNLSAAQAAALKEDLLDS